MKSEYTLDPNSVIFDDKYVIFNPLHNEIQYGATKASIEMNGQTEPILMIDGKCVDGRHRTRIAKELNISVKAIDLPEDMSEHATIIRCNENVMSGRDYDNAQKAIQALKLVNDFDFKVVQAAKMMKIDRRMVSYAASIKGYGRQDILDTLLEGHKVQLTTMDRPSKSLEVICKHIKANREEESIVVDDSNRVKFSVDAIIKTEKGKAWYYGLINSEGIKPNQVSTRLALMELANYKFKTGELNE